MLVLKDKILSLIDAKVIKLKPKKKNISADMATMTMGCLEVPTGAVLILVGKMVIVNHDPYNLKQKGLSLVSTSRGEIVWVCPDLLSE